MRTVAAGKGVCAEGGEHQLSIPTASASHFEAPRYRGLPAAEPDQGTTALTSPSQGNNNWASRSVCIPAFLLSAWLAAASGEKCGHANSWSESRCPVLFHGPRADLKDKRGRLRSEAGNPNSVRVILGSPALRKTEPISAPLIPGGNECRFLSHPPACRATQAK